MKPGRNDPCHCGSGKKYKKCHLQQDEQARRATSLETGEGESLAGAQDDAQSMTNWDNRPGNAGRNSRKKIDLIEFAQTSGLLKESPELRRILEENKTVLNYASHELEIESAFAKLKPYEHEFDDLLTNPEAFLNQSQRLFCEESFAHLRFTSEDVETAFKEVGFPERDRDDEETRETLLKATRFLASKERRNQLGMELLLLVPSYVEQGRFRDGCLIASAADELSRPLQQPSAFLLCMFLHGLTDWEEKQDREMLKILRKEGFPLGENLTPTEIDEWVAKSFADPSKTARLEELARAHPELFGSRGLSPQQLANQSVPLFGREDSSCLLLSPAEAEPWVPFLMDKLQQMLTEHGPEEGEANVAEDRQKRAFENVYLPAMREIAKGIFTSERIKKLVQDLTTYRNKLFAAGEKAAALAAQHAIQYVGHEDDPAQNVFLVNLCAHSLMNEKTLAGQKPSS